MGEWIQILSVCLFSPSSSQRSVNEDAFVTEINPTVKYYNNNFISLFLCQQICLKTPHEQRTPFTLTEEPADTEVFICHLGSVVDVIILH